MRGSLLNDVKQHLRGKRALLVLDNFEHVTEAAGFVAELLATAPGLGAIVTSRAVLRLYGEWEYPLAPLPKFAFGWMAFPWPSSWRPPVSRLLAPQAMLERLESRLHFLAARGRDLPARQSTLRATIDWSFNLLAERERELFTRLSVFVGGFTLAAAEAWGQCRLR